MADIATDHRFCVHVIKSSTYSKFWRFACAAGACMLACLLACFRNKSGKRTKRSCNLYLDHTEIMKRLGRRDLSKAWHVAEQGPVVLAKLHLQIVATNSTPHLQAPTNSCIPTSTSGTYGYPSNCRRATKPKFFQTLSSHWPAPTSTSTANLYTLKKNTPHATCNKNSLTIF